MLRISGETSAEDYASCLERIAQMEAEIKAKKKQMKILQHQIDNLRGELRADLEPYDQHLLLKFLDANEGKKEPLEKSTSFNKLRRLGVTVKTNEEELQLLAQKFKANIPRRARKYHHKVIPNAFTGIEAVDWLIHNWPRHTKLSRAQAVWVGNLLMRIGLFTHFTRILPFHDKEYFYVFREDQVKLCKSSSGFDALKPFLGLLTVSLKEIRGVKLRDHTRLDLICDNQWYRINIQEWHKNPRLKLYFYITRSNAELVLESKKYKNMILLHTLGIDEPHCDWYGLKNKNSFGPFLQLQLHYVFLQGKDEGFGQPPQPFAPDKWSFQKDDSARRSYGLGTQTKAAGHRPIHRCCALNNIFLPVRNKTEWEQLEETETNPGRATAHGVFGYGNVTCFALSKEKVEVFIQPSPPYGSWLSIGVTETNKDGRMQMEIPFDACPVQTTPGHYPVRIAVLGDNSLAYGQLWVLNHGVGGVLYDIDGTLTPGDDQIILEMALNSVKKAYDPSMRPGAVALCKAWAAKGYLPIYLSGRSGSTYNLTREWLVAHGFPPGLIIHTDKHAPTLPVYSSVGIFKRDHILRLRKQLGMQFIALYGNTMTDIRAYEEVEHPKERTFIVGKFGGKNGTVDLGNDFVEHVQYVVEQMPDAQVPAPREFFEW
jgi:hypothetical protein